MDCPCLRFHVIQRSAHCFFARLDFVGWTALPCFSPWASYLIFCVRTVVLPFTNHGACSSTYSWPALAQRDTRSTENILTRASHSVCASVLQSPIFVFACIDGLNGIFCLRRCRVLVVKCCVDFNFIVAKISPLRNARPELLRFVRPAYAATTYSPRGLLFFLFFASSAVCA